MANAHGDPWLCNATRTKASCMQPSRPVTPHYSQKMRGEHPIGASERAEFPHCGQLMGQIDAPHFSSIAPGRRGGALRQCPVFTSLPLYMAQLLSWASCCWLPQYLGTYWNTAEMGRACLQTAPASTPRKDCTMLFHDDTRRPSFCLFNEDTRVSSIYQPYSLTQSRADPSFLRPYHSSNATATESFPTLRQPHLWCK